MMMSANPTCTGLENLVAAPTCTYDTAKQTLVLTSVTPVDLAGGTQISFKVDNFLNPYNGIQKLGFIVTIYEGTGVGAID
jgi:hypothetical protein